MFAIADLTKIRPQTKFVAFGTLAVCLLLSFMIHKQARYQPPPMSELMALHIEHAPPKPIAQIMTVEQAYGTLGRVYRPFDITKGKMAYEDARYLDGLFRILDLGIIERIQWYETLRAKNSTATLANNHGEILRRLDTRTPPASLERVHYLILNAVNEQKIYFDEWKNHPGQSFNPQHPLVRSSHAKLVEAYGLLMTAYADEEEYNRKSFYDHLCVLSFL